MSSTDSSSQAEGKQVLLKDVVVSDKNVAVNLMAVMLDAAQRRGAFNLEESAKIWECIQKMREGNDSASAAEESVAAVEDSPSTSENVSMQVTESA